MAISTDDRRFLLLCTEVRENSHDPHRKVGVVVVDDDGQILAAGTNAPPASLGLTISESHEAIRQNPAWKYFMLEHAERNAIFAAYGQRRSLLGATMYASLFPCADCARAIVATGISRLVVLGAALDPIRDQKWLEHYGYAKSILKQAGVALDIVEPEELSEADRL